MDILDQFADGVTEIDISSKNIEGILDFKRFTKLIKLICNNNQIISLDNLSDSLIELYCNNNQITSLDNLRSSLQILYCIGNKITSLDNLRS
jgi:Leucine-rich repeat (LRR) protein